MNPKTLTKLILLIRRKYELSIVNAIAVNSNSENEPKSFSIYNAQGEIKQIVTLEELLKDKEIKSLINE